MRIIDVMKRAGRNLSQAKGRTLLTSLAIAVGAFTLTLSLAAGEGARQYVDDLLKNNISPQALFIVKDKSLAESGGQPGLREYSEDLGSSSRPGATIELLNKSDVTKLRARDDIKNVVPIYEFSPTYVEFEGAEKKYVAPTSYYDSSIVSDTAAGSLPELNKQIDDKDILVAQEFVDKLGIKPNDMIGKTITLTMTQSKPDVSQEEVQKAVASGDEAAISNLLKSQTKEFEFKVRAVVKKSAMALTSNPQLQVSANAAQTLSEYSYKGTDNADKYFGATALAINDAAAAKDSIEKDLDFSVQTAKDAQTLIFSFVNILQGIVAGFAILALIASVFGIINTQYISVLERTSQIGLMKALGMRRRDIAKLFRYEAAWIGFLGGALGILGALLVGYLANPVLTEKLDLGEDSLLIFVWWQIAILLVSLVVIAIVAGWFPARKAAKLDPIEALRTE